MIKGTDLSHWNSKVDYAAMKAAGIRFACIKLGQGGLSKDHLFDTHTAGCDSVGVPWDLYFFCDYRLSGFKNVEQLIAKAAGNYGMKHVVQDLEFYDGFGPRPDGRHMLIFCLDFFNALYVLTGINGYLYTNRDLINQMVAAATPEQLAKLLSHPLWLASDRQNPNHAPWSDDMFKLNQYELDVYATWAQGTVDYDEFNGDEAAFQAWCSAASPPVDKLEVLWAWYLETHDDPG